MQQTILIIDDDKELTDILKVYLEKTGYIVDVENDSFKGLNQATTGKHYSLILLDVMMPGINGFELLSKLRTTVKTPVLMLTAKGEELDRIRGFELGADDYLPKPFSHRELLVRINAIFRRQHMEQSNTSSEVVAVGRISLNTKRFEVKVDSQTVVLTNSEFVILKLFLMMKGELVTKEDISEKALGKKLIAYDRSIDMHVCNIRKKLNKYISENFIKTIRGSGYMLLVDACGV